MFLSARKTYAVRLLNEYKPNMAIDELEYIVRIFKEDKNGDYAESNLIEPLALLANAYATVGRLDEAIKRYKKALSMAEKHVGPRHQSISAHLINYATALIHVSKFDEAIKLAERGLNILQLNGIINDPLIPAAHRVFKAGKNKINKIVLEPYKEL
jgi:tetratricopeptide (TPR) repeat protein